MSVLRHIDFEVPDWGEFAAPPVDKPGYRTLVLSHLPLAYWRLGEAKGSTASDETGNHPGTRAAGVSWNHDGVLAFDENKAARFDGTTSAYIEVPSHDDFHAMSALTVLVWIRAEDFSSLGHVGVISKGDWSELWSLYLRQFGSGNQGIAFAVNGNTSVRASVADNQWHFLAGTWDGTTLRLFKDGQLIDSAPENGAMGINGTPVRIGEVGKLSGSPDNFLGLMDEVAVFNHALTEQQISELYRTGAGL